MLFINLLRCLRIEEHIHLKKERVGAQRNAPSALNLFHGGLRRFLPLPLGSAITLSRAPGIFESAEYPDPKIFKWGEEKGVFCSPVQFSCKI